VHPVIRSTLTALAATYALAWAGAAMVVGPGSATLVQLTGDLRHAGSFVALFSVSSATGALILGRLMDPLGRKKVLTGAHLSGATGYLLAGIATATGHIPLFLMGAFMLAFSFGGILLTRVAAAEIFPATQRGRGVSYVQVSATLGAILGPLLLILSDPLGHLVHRDPLTIVWFFAPPLHLLAAALILRIHEPLQIASHLEDYHPPTDLDDPSTGPRGVKPPLPTLYTPNTAPAHLLPLAILALAANQAAMAAVMGVAGAAVHHAGHETWLLGLLMFLHFLGMFGLSPLVGRIADRFGRRNTILSGILLLATGGIIIALLPDLTGFAIGLLLVGLGWSFGFIGATVLLTDITVLHRRARIVGRADLTAQLSAAAASLTAGWLFTLHGMPGLGILAVAIVTVPFVAMMVRKRAPTVPETS
jgi:MFS family permease